MFDSHMQMYGDLRDSNGTVIQRGGFMAGSIPQGGFHVHGVNPMAPSAVERAERVAQYEALQRGEFDGDANKLLIQVAADLAELQRGITSGTTGLPVRENLELPASLLIPTETPVRNLLPRVPGAGLASKWKQITSLGGGWGTSYDQPGGGSAIRMFYPETGAPVEHTTVYANKTADYKLLGTLGSVTNFAQAAGAATGDLLAAEQNNQIQNLMLNEEYSLLWGDSTATAAPWGDGSNPLAYDGLMVLTSTANGTPSDQIQTSVGQLTTAHIDAQITRLWKQGGRGLYMIVNAQEAQSLVKLLSASGNIQRLMITDQGNVRMGFRVSTYIHPISGQEVSIHVSLFQKAGEIFYGAHQLPDGRPVADVEVLPQVPVPAAPEKPQQIQGYVMTMLARSLTQPDVEPFMISVYQVLRLKSTLHVAKSSGVTAA